MGPTANRIKKLFENYEHQKELSKRNIYKYALQPKYLPIYFITFLVSGYIALGISNEIRYEEFRYKSYQVSDNIHSFIADYQSNDKMFWPTLGMMMSAGVVADLIVLIIIIAFYDFNSKNERKAYDELMESITNLKASDIKDEDWQYIKEITGLI